MFLRALFYVVLLALPAMLAHAQVGRVYLAWDACPGTTGANSTATFDCDPTAGTVYRLYGAFELSGAASGIVALDAVMDLIFSQTEVAPFWQMAAGECNELGAHLAAPRPEMGCNALGDGVCGPNATGCDHASISGYAWGSSVGLNQNRARMFLTLTRPSLDPIDLPAASRQFGFALDFYMQNPIDPARECPGCGDEGASSGPSGCSTARWRPTVLKAGPRSWQRPPQVQSREWASIAR